MTKEILTQWVMKEAYWAERAKKAQAKLAK